MDIKTSVFKRPSRIKNQKRKGGIVKPIKVRGGWVYRIHYVDGNGEHKCIERGFYDLKSHANDALSKHLETIKPTGGESRKGERMTFDQLADMCEAEFYKPAVIVEGKKIAGVRSNATAKGLIKNLKAYFGKRRIGTITRESLFAYREHRLKPQPAKKEGGEPWTLKIASVNRELAVMRKILRFAFRNGWTPVDAFYNAQVIEASHETARQRLLSRAEEARLLANCQGTREVLYTRKIRGKEENITATVSLDNPALKAIIILALDSGMRRGEILKMRWQDIDFENGLIRVVGTHTKTERERMAPLSTRAAEELINLRPLVKADRPFPFTDIKRSFATAKRLAGINDLRFHDLRRTAVTRWLYEGTPLALAGKFAGHSQLQTTVKHYAATDDAMLRELRGRIDGFNEQKGALVIAESAAVN